MLASIVAKPAKLPDEEKNAGSVVVISEVDVEIANCLDTLNGSKRNITSIVNAIDSNTELPILRDVSQRKAKFMDYLGEGITNSNLTAKEHQQVFFAEKLYHDVFSFDDGDRGVTALIQIKIEMSDAVPKKQVACRTPFAMRHGVEV